jgi:hypothetical protein
VKTTARSYWRTIFTLIVKRISPANIIRGIMNGVRENIALFLLG